MTITSLFCAASVFFTVSADHADNHYVRGETAHITVAVKDAQGALLTNGIVRVRVDNFGDALQYTTNVDVRTVNPFPLTAAMTEPGFVRVCLETPGGETTWTTTEDIKAYEWSLACEPGGIVKGSELPSDFDTFWSEARAKLAREVPLDPQVEKIEARSQGGFDYFRISFATFGRRVYGLMTVPKDASADKKYPVLFQVPGAGCGTWNQDIEGSTNDVRVFMTVFDWPPDKENFSEVQKKFDAMQAKISAEYGMKDEIYNTAGISRGRETYWYYPVILGIDRVVDWAAALPYARDVRYHGTSQGGMFGLILTGLNKKIVRSVVYVPAGCDTLGYKRGRRRSGWPRIVERQPIALREKTAVNAAYFDGANFATRISCPIRFVAGYSDAICPPAAVWATYNACPSGDKSIDWGVGMTHAVFGKFYSTYQAWLTEDLSK